MKKNALMKASNLIEILQLEVVWSRYRLARSWEKFSSRGNLNCLGKTSIGLRDRNIETATKNKNSRIQTQCL